MKFKYDIKNPIQMDDQTMVMLIKEHNRYLDFVDTLISCGVEISFNYSTLDILLSNIGIPIDNPAKDRKKNPKNVFYRDYYYERLSFRDDTDEDLIGRINELKGYAADMKRGGNG